MARCVEQRKGFGPALDRSRFATARTLRHGVLGDDRQQVRDELACVLGRERDLTSGLR
jgi:hypothetical protein